MNSNRAFFTLMIALLSIGGCRSAGTDSPGKPKSMTIEPSSLSKPTTEAESTGAEESTILRDLLRRAHEDRSGWESLQLLAECREPDNPHLRSTVIYGSGVGIWEERLQFALSEDQTAALLGFLRDADFLDLPDLFGAGGSDEGEQPDSPSFTDGGVRIICRVSLEIGGHDKVSAQRIKGAQSAELRALAERVLDYCEPLAERGVGAESLNNGLAKIATGELAPETLNIVLHRKPEPGAQSRGVGFRLIIEGTTAKLRGFTAGEGYGDERVVALDRSEVEDMARRMSEIGVQELPVNLWAEDYTDLRIEILNQREAIQARQFAGMTRSTHGEDQVAFEKILEIFEMFSNQAFEATF